MNINPYAYLDEYNSRYTEMIRQACIWLVDTKKMASRREIRHLDMIDVTDTFELPSKKYATPYVDKNHLGFAAISENWMNAIPPFTSGCVRINIERYIYYEVASVDTENRIVQIRIVDYSYSGKVWGAGFAATFAMRVSDGEVEIAMIDKRDMNYIFSLVEPDKIGWNREELSFWKKDVLPRVKASVEQLEKNDMINATCVVFLAAIGLTNHYLSQNKPKAVRKDSRKVTSVADGESSKRIVRMVGNGGIRITSKKIPRYAADEIVRHYRVAAWNTRGHERHYKNGKVVYVKPSVHHRKCMSQEQKPVQTVIKVRDWSQALTK